jgi:hypothetical protein
MFFSVIQYLEDKESGFKASLGFRLAFLPAEDSKEAPTLFGLNEEADEEQQMLAGGIDSQDWYGSTFRFGWNKFDQDRIAKCGGYAGELGSVAGNDWITDSCPFAPEAKLKEGAQPRYYSKSSEGLEVSVEGGGENTEERYSSEDYEPSEVTGQTFLSSLVLRSELVQRDSDSGEDEGDSPNKPGDDKDDDDDDKCDEGGEGGENGDDDDNDNKSGSGGEGGEGGEGSGNCKAQAPAPLPIAGAGAAFAWSRRVRRRYTLVPAKAPIVS